MALHPGLGEGQVLLVAAFRREVEIVIGRVHHVEAARIAGIGVIDGAVVPTREHADARPLAERFLETVVVGDFAFRLLLVRLADMIIVAELGVGRRHPFEAPAHARLISPELVEWRARDRGKAHIALRKMHDKAVIPVGPERAVRAAGVPGWIEHEMLDDELAPAVEQIGQRFLPPRAIEDVILRDPHPWQPPPFRVEFVAQPREFLLL